MRTRLKRREWEQETFPAPFGIANLASTALPALSEYESTERKEDHTEQDSRSTDGRNRSLLCRERRQTSQSIRENGTDSRVSRAVLHSDQNETTDSHDERCNNEHRGKVDVICHSECRLTSRQQGLHFGYNQAFHLITSKG